MPILMDRDQLTTWGAIQRGALNPSGTFGVANALGVSNVDDLLSSVYNPTIFGADIQNQTLTGAELASFAKFYYNNFVVPTQNDADLRAYFDGKFPASLMMLLHAKFSFGQGKYGQYGASIQSTQIRPVTVFASGGSVVETWNTTVKSAGWSVAYFNIDLTTTSTTASLNLRDNVEMIIFGMADFSASPKAFEFQFNENGSTPLGVKSHSLVFTPASQRLILLDQVYGIPKNTKYTVDVNFSASGNAAVAPLGIQFVTQTLVTQE